MKSQAEEGVPYPSISIVSFYRKHGNEARPNENALIVLYILECFHYALQYRGRKISIYGIVLSRAFN